MTWHSILRETAQARSACAMLLNYDDEVTRAPLYVPWGVKKLVFFVPKGVRGYQLGAKLNVDDVFEA